VKRLLIKIELLLKEISDFCFFFHKLQKRLKAIVFYAEHKGYYPNFEGIIEKLTGEYNRHICYITSDPEDPILKSTKDKVTVLYCNKLLAFFMVFVDCRVFVMTMTDLNRFHLKRSIKPVTYVYMFHAMVSTHMMYRYGAFDHYDYILCTGPHQIDEIRRHEKDNNLPAKRLIEAGYPRVETIYKAYKNYVSRDTRSKTKKTVLIAPSWGAANILKTCGERLVRLLLTSGFEVIVRPHPETRKRSPKLLNSLMSKFGKDPDFILETSVAADDSVLKADVLICDCSGIALEYAFGTERPVLFLDVPVKIKNQDFRALGIEPLELSLRSKIGILVPLGELNRIPERVSMLIAEREVYKGRLTALREKYVFAFGRSSQIGAACINRIAETDQNS